MGRNPVLEGRLYDYYHYRLGATKSGVPLYCTFNGTITISNRSLCTHNGFAQMSLPESGVMLALPRLKGGEAVCRTGGFPHEQLLNPEGVTIQAALT
ncbi:hypothetical protein G7B40_031810 [Aetokthonos hydrillicola Thurmond2011]|uniref:Uncharacterized protein n=1 Tax=Aetokthonos hydrillicola Thurmond2011 TaxID=2712845 RepID=A0AAP5ID94_9CYAN|nr:hypothetical protein [Aetokthonos hydrillicola CCALA 1050]MBW4589619.1 hypothetical protein [Aetokthonos hydrillicola CCALA 1050]MDR9899114.1 hypothetical protein [Aetokthonos hydrillicola Thurmond2011]